MIDPHEALLEFHREFGHTIGDLTSLPSVEDQILRLKLVLEEITELFYSMQLEDPEEIADAIADSLYVLYGTAITYGIDIRPVFEEVHRTNMLKKGGEKDTFGKTLKPEGWEPPRTREILEEQGLK